MKLLVILFIACTLMEANSLPVRTVITQLTDWPFYNFRNSFNTNVMYGLSQGVIVTVASNTSTFRGVSINKTVANNSYELILNKSGNWVLLSNDGADASCYITYENYTQTFALLRFRPDLGILDFVGNITNSSLPDSLKRLPYNSTYIRPNPDCRSAIVMQ